MEAAGSALSHGLPRVVCGSVGLSLTCFEPSLEPAEHALNVWQRVGVPVSSRVQAELLKRTSPWKSPTHLR